MQPHQEAPTGWRKPLSNGLRSFGTRLNSRIGLPQDWGTCRPGAGKKRKSACHPLCYNMTPQLTHSSSRNLKQSAKTGIHKKLSCYRNLRGYRTQHNNDGLTVIAQCCFSQPFSKGIALTSDILRSVLLKHRTALSCVKFVGSNLRPWLQSQLCFLAVLSCFVGCTVAAFKRHGYLCRPQRLKLMSLSSTEIDC